MRKTPLFNADPEANGGGADLTSGVFGRIGAAIRNEYAPILGQAAIDKAALVTATASLAAVTGEKAALELNIVELTAENARLNTLVGTTSATLATLKAEKETFDTTIASLDELVPGIKAAGGSKEAIQAAFTLAITNASANSIAEMGMAAGTAPGTDPNPSETRTLDEQYAELKTPEEKAAFVKANGNAILK